MLVFFIACVQEEISVGRRLDLRLLKGPSGGSSDLEDRLLDVQNDCFFFNLFVVFLLFFLNFLKSFFENFSKDMKLGK